MLINNRTNPLSNLPKYYEQALLDIILGGDHYRNGMVQNSDTLMNNTVDAFLSDLKRAKV
jgi:GTP1/Obg family GTP-binding protein